MAAPRTSSLRALRALSKTATTTPRTSTRGLRITPHNESSPFLTTAKPSFTKVQAAIDEASAEASKPAPAAVSTRHFNTSRSLKSVGDSSTIDFAFLPEDFDPDTSVKAGGVRVPLLPESLYGAGSKIAYGQEVEERVMRPEISTTSGDVAPSAFADVVDNGAIDFHGLAETAKEKASEEVGELRRVLSGLVDDILGPAPTRKTA